MSLLLNGHVTDIADVFAVDMISSHREPLAAMTTLGVGGTARYYLYAESPAVAHAGVVWAREEHLPLLILGRGSNMLISDDGFPGLVLHIAIQGMDYREREDAVEIQVGAGESWNSLVAFTISRNLAGLECLAGIPGTVGAAPIQNIGAYGQEVKESIVDVEVLDLHSGQIEHFTNDACEFSYRMSRFKRSQPGRYLVLSVTFRLTPNGQPTVRYAELERYFAASGIHAPGLADVRDAVLDIRRRKSMLLDARDPNTRSAGSFFTNPMVPSRRFIDMETTIAPVLKTGERIPGYAQPDGTYKVSAAWLIEHAGFSRGFVQGNVGLSTNHTLAIINRGGATAHEVIALARDIHDRVFDRFGVSLAPEPTLVGIHWDGK